MWFGHGNFLLGIWFLNMENFWSGMWFLVMKNFLLGMRFLVMGKFFVGHEIFGYGKFLLDMRFLVTENFCWVWDFWSWKKNFGHVILEWKILVDMWFLIMLMMGQILFCKTSKAEVVFKCWKAYRKYCLRILGTSLMTRASRLSLKLYCTRKLMSTRISNYSLLCQNGFGIPRAHSIF